MKKYILFLLFIGILGSSCSKNSDAPEVDGPVTEEPDPGETVEPDLKETVEPGLMHIKRSDYTAENSILMLQDDEDVKVIDGWDRVFYIHKPMTAIVTAEGELRIQFFSVRPVLNVEIYAPQPSGEYFKLATYDSIPAFAESRMPLPEIKEGTKLILESGDSTYAETSFSLSKEDTLKIVCNEEYYQKLTTQNKCRWYIGFDPMHDGHHCSDSKPLLPVHAREAVALLSNMAYMFSSDDFVTGNLHLQGKIYTDKGYGDWVDMAGMLNDIYANRRIYIVLVSVDGAMGVVAGSFYGLIEDVWFNHYEGPAMIPFHEFGHVLKFDHGSNMTMGDADYALWPDFCGELYKRMCITKELPVWSSKFLDSSNNPNSYGKKN